MKPVGLIIVLSLMVLNSALAEDMTDLPEGSAFRVLGVTNFECDSAPCLKFTILCERKFYHGRIAGLLLRAIWYAPDGSRNRTTVNQDGSCGLGGEITQTHLQIPQPGSGFTYTVEPSFK